MCGIIGIMNVIEYDITKQILESLTSLENRGYDSSGLCIFVDNTIYKSKKIFENKKKPILQLQREEFPKSFVGFGHNRWATHGEKTVTNAHPHVSNNNCISIVHNGIIENYLELKKFLIEKKFNFYSQTDTEVIVNLLQYYEEQNKDIPFEKTIETVIENIKGTFAFIIFNKKNPNYLYCVRRGSPLLVGYNDSFVMITSEQSGFSESIKMFIVLNNNDICVLHRKTDTVEMKVNQNYTKTKLNHILLPKSPFPFEHWTLKEIYEQSETVLNAINYGGRIDCKNVYLGGCERMRSHLEKKHHIILIGCGTSYHACMFARSFFKKSEHFITVSVFDGAEFELNDIPDREETLCVFVSQSGETIDLYHSLILCKQKNIMTLGIINVVNSLIAREVDCGIYCNAEREVGVASTKAFTSQVICLVLLSLWFSQISDKNKGVRKKIMKDLLCLSKDFELCIKNSRKQISSIFPIIKNAQNMFLLGKEKDEYIAREGSLKIKEISYIHSEAYSISGLKHGPFALLGKNMPVILIHTNKNYESKLLGSYEEIKSRKAPIIFITPFTDLNIPNTILIPSNETFSSLLAIVPLQLLAYELSLSKDLNPDTPRNLAKVVTVD
jgi:glucosamine--fructose-6-phosphate aminotransferase (isomerizing)